MPNIRWITLMICLFLSIHTYSQPKQSNVYNGVEFIVNKFDTHDIIAIGETHDKIEVTDFYIKLVQNEEFRKKVDFLVIEMGNHFFQEVLNDYISGGEVDEKVLYKLWRDHTSCMLNGSDNTGMIRLLDAVREANLNSTYKIQILAGDPAIDWAAINCLQKFYKYLGSRDKFYTEIVAGYVVEPKKKALLIMGNSHFNKSRTIAMVKNDLQNPITTLINTYKSNLLLLNIITVTGFPYANLQHLEKGSVVLTLDPWLGNLTTSAPFINNIPLKDQTDGIIYLGEKKSLTSEETSNFDDQEYEKELERRNNLPDCDE